LLTTTKPLILWFSSDDGMPATASLLHNAPAVLLGLQGLDLLLLLTIMVVVIMFVFWASHCSTHCCSSRQWYQCILGIVVD